MKLIAQQLAQTTTCNILSSKLIDYVTRHQRHPPDMPMYSEHTMALVRATL